MKDYRVKVKVRNNRILSAIEMAGGTVGGKWCEENGLSYVGVNDLINMTTSPLKVCGSLKDVSMRLCEVLNCIPDDLWSSEQLYPLEVNFSEFEMTHDEMQKLLPSQDDIYIENFDTVDEEKTKKLLGEALDTLSLRERRVLKLRHEDGLTLNDCGKVMDVTQERVRQIEMKALRKLRSPARIGMFVDCLDYSKEETEKYKQCTQDWKDGTTKMAKWQ